VGENDARQAKMAGDLRLACVIFAHRDWLVVSFYFKSQTKAVHQQGLPPNRVGCYLPVTCPAYPGLAPFRLSFVN